MNIYIKALVFLIIFIILHFGHEVTRIPLLTPLFATNESVFQHLKIAFWGYMLTSIMEYFIVKKSYNSLTNFWYSRSFATITVPWFIFLVWYLAPALSGKIQIPVMEVAWGILVTYAGGLIAAITEENMETTMLMPGFKIVIICLFIIAAFLFTWFTYQLPWIDLFTIPEFRLQ